MIDSSLREISQEFFESCENLALIEQPFSISDIAVELEIRDLQNEFELMRALTQTKKHRMRLRSNTAVEIKKNRYPQQAIYEHSRVILQDGAEEGGYINANYIFGLESQPSHKMILTQGPINNTIQDFNKMIQREEIECVVMLCRLIENGKNRCSNYIADCTSQERDKFGDYITVTTVNLGQQYQNHQYEHVYYSEWPDKKVPSQLKHISQLLAVIQKYKKIVVHCSAGLGRSGVIGAILLIMKSKMFNKQKKLSIFQAVRKMREYRFGAIQNSQQYAFLYSFFKDYHHNNA